MTDSDSNPKHNDNWQAEIVNRLAFAALNEQRRARRWNIFFRTLFLAYLFLLFFAFYLPERGGKAGLGVGKHTALVELKGVIADDAEANADDIVTGLRAAFKDKNTVGVILRINSPGGSPVQSAYIHDEIRRLRKKYPDTRLYAVISDMAASGGYYVAAAADEIYANPSSIVGSIGVLMNGFGFVDAMDKLGIERRLYTAGEHKGMLDPFSDEKPDEVQHVKGLLNDIHQQFISAVRAGRGERLKEDDTVFSGMFWTAEKGKELGLVDGFGSASYVAREIIKQEKIVDYTPQPDYLERFAERFGAASARALAQLLGTTGGTIR